MGNLYLYGARNDDPRYLQSFESKYSGMGTDLLRDVQNGFSEANSHSNLLGIMQKGYSNALRLATRQAKSFGYSDVDEFCKDYNELIRNFEYLAFTLLEQTSRFVAYDIEDNIEKIKKEGIPYTIDEGIDRTKLNKTTIKALENTIDNAGEDFWETISGLVKSNSGGMKDKLKELVALREVQVLKGNDRYTGIYGGKLGELTVQLVQEGIANATFNCRNRLVEELRKTKGVTKIVGGEGKKADTKTYELMISIKNYTGIRNQFHNFSKDTLNDKTKKLSAIDVTIQKTGQLQTILENFQSGSGQNVIKGDMQDYYSFVMNAIYFNQFGIGDYYQTAMQALDILVNVYAYTFMVQGTTKKLGFAIQDIDTSNMTMPGFMWFVGKGMVPIYKILEEIADNFAIIMNKTRAESRSGTYAFLKLSGIKEAVNAVDVAGAHTNPYGKNQTLTNGLYYRHSRCYPRLQEPSAVLAERYSVFNKTVKTSVKLHLQMNLLQGLVGN